VIWFWLYVAAVGAVCGILLSACLMAYASALRRRN
jgi:hypothetical protein